MKIKEVSYKKNNKIICIFNNNIKKVYDINKITKKNSAFLKLKDNEELLKKVKVDTGGYGVSWNEELDLASEEIWNNGEEIE